MGIICAVTAAIIYGFTPILARITFGGGANGITVTFLRGLLSIPLLMILIIHKKIPLRLGIDWKGVFLAGIFGMSPTALLLYMSYGYISVGLAETLHFTYPILVTVTCIVWFKEKLNRWKLGALILCSIGIFMFIDKISSFGVTGMVLALLSGVAYAYYIICVDKVLMHIHYLKLILYMNIFMTVISGGYGLCTGNLHLSLTPNAWVLCILISLLTSFGALPLLQVGIKLTGASTTAILSTFEPITSVVCGILILHESISPLKLFGCVFIMGSILLIAISENKIVNKDSI